MEIENQELNTNYLVKPWIFGKRNGLEDKMLFSALGTNLIADAILIPSILMLGVSETAMNMGIDKTASICGLLTTSLIAYAFNKIQLTGLTYNNRDTLSKPFKFLEKTK